MNKGRLFLLASPAIGIPIPRMNFNELPIYIQIGWAALIVILFVMGIYYWVSESRMEGANMKSGKLVFKGAAGSDMSINLASVDMATHAFIMGSTRRGRSSSIEIEATRRGVSYEEAEKAF